MSFIGDALYALFEWPPRSRLEREIWYTERALDRYKARTDKIRRDFLSRGGGCCAHCASGGELSYFEGKVERVEVQLRRLYKARKN